MARVLMLTQVLPYPLDAGPKVRAYYMLRHLAERHEVTLVSFVRADDTPQAVGHLRELAHAVHTAQVHRSAARNIRAGLQGLLTGQPMVIARDRSREMSGLLQQLAAQKRFDMVHADQLSMSGYGRQAAQTAADGVRPRTLLDEHNAIYLLAQRIAVTETRPVRHVLTVREARAFRRYEREMCRRYDAVLTVTAEDREHLLALLQPEEVEAARHKFRVVPICVDTEEKRPVLRTGDARPTILHLGTMFWPPNVGGVLWFAREVLPLVRREIPGVRFVVIGKDPPPEVCRLASDPNIEVTGYMADPAPYLALTDVFVVPLHAAGGMRVKILDAWSWGLPIVSTPIGAEGIECRDGEHLLIAAEAEAFAGAVVRLLNDAPLNRRLRAAGRRWAEAHYGWRQSYEQVDEVYAELLR